MNINDFNKEIVISEIAIPSSASHDFEWEETIMYKKESYDLRTQSVTLSNNPYTPTAKDKLYFFPGCNVPRYKVREWGKKNNVSVTISPDKATAKFASTDSINRCFSYEVFLKIPKDEFISWMDVHYTKGSGNIDLLYKKLEESDINFVYLQKYGYTSINRAMYIKDYQNNLTQQASNDGFKEDLCNINNIESYYRGVYLTNANYINFKELMESPNIYSQEDIIGLISEDSLTIDSDMYNTIRDMFKSNNDADKAMALEILANCNIAPSLHHVLLLIKEFAGTIYNMKESKHVNFKSLLEYLDLTRNNMYNINEDVMMTSLMDKDVLTEKIMIELADGIKELWKAQYDSTHFKINTITVSDEVKNYFKRKQELQTA